MLKTNTLLWLSQRRWKLWELLGSKLLNHPGPWDANVAWAGAKVPRSLKKLSSEFSLLWTGTLGEIFSSGQQCSTPLTLTSSGSREPSAELSWLAGFNTVFDLKALRGGKIICIFKSGTVYTLSRVCFTSDLNSAIKLSLPRGRLNYFPLCRCAKPGAVKGESALLSTAFWLDLGALLGKFNGCLRRELEQEILTSGSPPRAHLLKLYSFSWALVSSAVFRLPFITFQQPVEVVWQPSYPVVGFHGSSLFSFELGKQNKTYL